MKKILIFIGASFTFGIALLFAGVLPIEIVYPVSGATLYDIRHNPNGTVFNNNTSSFEAYSQSHWANYAIPMTEQAGSFYYRAVPPAQSTSVICTDIVYVQASTSTPTLGDIPIGGGVAAGANIAAVDTSVPAAMNFGQAAGSEVVGAAVSGTLSVTQMSTNLTNSLNNAYVGRTIIWTSGILTGVAAGITSYNGTTKVLSFTPVSTAPSATDTFIIV